MHWLSSHLGHPVSPPDLRAAGYRFLGGRLVSTVKGPAALFIYEDRRGERLAIFVRPLPVKRSTAIEAADIGNMDGCAWIDHRLGFTLVANESYKRLLDLSQAVRKQARRAG